MTIGARSGSDPDDTRSPEPPARTVRVLVAGASGFVGRALSQALTDIGHEVRAMTRRPDRYDGAGSPVEADVADVAALSRALRGCEVAYYLVHSLDHGDFADRDAAGAENFGQAAARAGVRRIVYLGGLGDAEDKLSAHLKSRQQVEQLLGAGGVPVTALRAGIVIGHGGASWEIIRNTVRKVPALAVPRWALTRTQPIALSDTVRYLVGVIAGVLDGTDDHADHVYEIGGAEVLRYVDVLSRVSALEGRPALIVPVAAPSPAVSLAARVVSRAMPLLTGVDRNTVGTLLQSMRNEVVVRDDSIRTVVPFEPMGYDEMVQEALQQRIDHVTRARRRPAA